MEAATLSSPQRKFEVVPVQKSLSLPSYARASGEGIDHRIIFAALEQKEKIRRKSRIFTREKSSRQNIFCLPISSNTKCKETSLSSDTSCSSLEYQKPKSTPKPKKKETKPSNNDLAENELSTAKTSQSEVKASQNHKDVVEKSVVEKEQELRKDSLKTSNCCKEYRSPSNTLKPNVNSSDSMERSSRSSNDSISRRERLVAIKAKVEAAREKYGDTSSEDENRSGITRYNSDGVIHRTVREVKSRSNRLEKRLRRRSQDEYALKKANRKNNLSFCLNSFEDRIKLDFNKPMNIFEDGQNLECKTDFCPSPNFLDFTKKNYFSDFPSKENLSRIVQTRIRHIEEEERKRRNSVDLREKVKFSSRQSPQNMENLSPFSTQHRNTSNQNTLNNMEAEKNPISDNVHCPSPVSRSSQAPTPPPRSPKSMTFINKVYIQHQNSYLNQDSRSLERKPYCHANVPTTFLSQSPDITNSKNDIASNGTKTVQDIFDDSAEKRKMKELFNSRRKTCGYFDYPENYVFKELGPTLEKNVFTKPTATRNAYNSQCSPKSAEMKGYLSGSENPSLLSEDANRRMWRSKWEETEKRQEFMFNSLESKKKTFCPSWTKWAGVAQRNDPCLCYLISGNKSICTCSQREKNTCNKMSNYSVHRQYENSPIYANVNEPEAFTRLSKSEINIAYSEQPKPFSHDFKFNNMSGNSQISEKNSSMEKREVKDPEKLSACANLESAMEELESVYRSLKFSSDNLSEKNSASNLSLNDLNIEISKQGSFASGKSTDSQSILHTPLKENILDFCNNKPNYFKPVNDKKCIEYSKSFTYAPHTDVTSDITKNLNSNNICIDELFNDLTRQLDIEQKQLKESREHRVETQMVNVNTDNCNKLSQKRMTPLESIVSIRKELYDNLQKNSHEKIGATSFAPRRINNEEEKEMAKRKYKAVRSLSENISYLMATANSNPVARKISSEKTESPVCSMETSIIEKSSPKHYEHVVLEPLKVETKKEVSLNNPIIPKRSFVADKVKNYGNEEIRQIRVSMDSNITQSNTKSTKPISDYPRLSSVVSRPQILSKNEGSIRLPQAVSASKETSEVLDESGLEKLLNTLLNEVPEPKQSSLLLSKDNSPATTPPPPPPVVSSGKSDHVKYKRNILSAKMDAYIAAAAKNKLTGAECGQRLKSEDIAQVKKDFCQNSAHLNYTSFIPVYSNKTVCHKFPTNECENPCSEKKILSTYSPPTRPRCITGNNDVIAARVAKTHMRRRSVGFEDMTSLSSCYGHNFTNDRMISDRRFQGPFHNSNIPQSSTENHSNFINSDNGLSMKKANPSENCFSSVNYNSQLSSVENANDNQQRMEKPLQRYKDKSSKRKSSLNRMDFFNLPTSNNGSTQFYSEISQQKNNSSSDEGSECRFRLKKSESPCSTSKRKHSANNTLSKLEMKTNEATLSRNSPTKVKSNLLPRLSHMKHSNHREIRWKQAAAIRFSHKLSHSAGELESLTDFSEVPSRNKTCLSAQEYDDQECSGARNNSSNSGSVLARNNLQKLSPRYLNRKEQLSSKSICDNPSQVGLKNESVNESENSILTKHNDSKNLEVAKVDCERVQLVDQKENISDAHSEQINETVDSVNDSILNLDCDDSIEFIDAEVDTSAIQLESLEIDDNSSKVADIYLSAEESVDVGGSDNERRPSSILRKKSFEEKKELHSILKPPPEDKTSKTPQSILKNRESSEEKDSWPSNDLHSILKKSTSEDESCNSGSDIRPILKLSTDEDSPSGAVRPRPILKKRTSFSDECSYVSFPSGELKPILKKKTPISSEDQPKPILKSRRKSEDTRSMSEVITSRPRAYSADMGIKINHENQRDNDNLEIRDPKKLDSHDL